MANYISKYTGAQIDKAVGDVLNGNVGGTGGGGNITIDDTLTKAGAAADAKATGDRLTALSEEIGNKAQAITEEVKAYYHGNVVDRNITVNGNAFSNAAVRIVGGKSHFITFYSFAANGATFTAHDGRFLSMKGELTANTQVVYLQAAKAGYTDTDAIRGKRIRIVTQSDRAVFARGYGSNVPKLVVRSDGAQIYAHTCDSIDIFNNDFFVDIPADSGEITISIWYLESGVNVDGVELFAGIYLADDTVIDTGKTVSDGETLTVEIPEGITEFDSMAHESSQTVIVDTKKYIDEHAPSDMLRLGDLYYVVPEMFGAVGDGIADDSEALQKTFDFAAANHKAIYTGGGTYLFENVKLYDGNNYEVFGTCFVDTFEWNERPSGCLLIKKGGVGFVGVRLSDVIAVSSLPTVRMYMHDLKIKGESGGGFPICFKDVRLHNSRIFHVQATWLSCFLEGMMVGDSVVEDCMFLDITESVYRGWTDINGIFNTNNHSFVDARFNNSRYAGRFKSSSTLFKPVVFDCSSFYCFDFSNNFVTNMWAIIATRNDVVNAWTSTDNIYTHCCTFAYSTGEITDGFRLRSSVLIHDSVRNNSYDHLTNTEEGKSYYDDHDGNTRLDENNLFFFAFDQFDSCVIMGLKVRNAGKILKDVTRFRCTTIGKAISYTELPYGQHAINAEKAAKNAFATKIPLDDFAANPEEYFLTSIESWSGRTAETLPVIQDKTYRYVLEGQTCYHNHKLLTCHGENWYDTMGNVVTA